MNTNNASEIRPEFRIPVTKRFQDSFWNRTNVTPDCWMWTGAKSSRPNQEASYGNFWFRKKHTTAHRVSWVLFKGEIPAGLYVLHRCDNPACVNPEHLFIGTPQDNMDDKVKKGRQARGGTHGRYTKPERTARGGRHGSKTRPESVMKGAAHQSSKLTENDVKEIREMYASGKFFQREIGDKFGIHQGTVSYVVLRKRWDDVA